MKIKVEDKDSPMSHYLRQKKLSPDITGTYLEWLERQYEKLSYDFVHPDSDEMGKMTQEEASHMVEERVYHAACLAERFENNGKFKGNGHHFAQNVAAFAKDQFKDRWLK